MPFAHDGGSPAGEHVVEGATKGGGDDSQQYGGGTWGSVLDGLLDADSDQQPKGDALSGDEGERVEAEAPCE